MSPDRRSLILALPALAAPGLWAAPVLADEDGWSAARGPAPHFGFETLDGAGLSLGDFSGRFVLVNLWATWCGPCMAELPSLDRLAGLQQRGGLQVAAISQDKRGAPAVLACYRRLGVKRLTAYLDTAGAASDAFAARGLPTSILMGPDGRLIARRAGAIDWDDNEERGLLGRMMAAASRALDVTPRGTTT